MKKLGHIILLLFIFSVAWAQNDTKEEERGLIYNPLGKRDPFIRPAGVEQPRGLATADPLQKFELNQFALKAILRGMGAPKAMFEDPEKKTYILSEGDRLGRERAVISRILNAEVIVTEKTTNYLGRESLFERVLSLPKDEEQEGGNVALPDQSPGNGNPGQ